MKVENTHIIARARSEIFKMLSECFSTHKNLTPGHINDLRNHMEKICPDAVPAVEKMSSSFAEHADTGELTIDYARLFIGPFALLSPPFGSVYLEQDRQVMGESTRNVIELYMTFELELAPDFHNAPDHIIAELEFMYYLVFRELEALKCLDEDSRIYLHRSEKLFLETYLAPWINEFTVNIEQHARTSFYRNLALATRRFIEKEQKYFSENVL